MKRSLLEDHIGLVKSIVCRFEKNSLLDSDLFGIGCLALVEAHKSYNPDKGAFSTWATKLIKQSIFDNLKKNKKVTNSIEDANIVDDSKPEFPEELYALLMSNDEAETDSEKQNKKILIDHFINNRSWAEIGREISLTRERVRQKGLDAINQIRKKYRLILDDFVFTID